jgi:hypothetical protein
MTHRHKSYGSTYKQNLDLVLKTRGDLSVGLRRGLLDLSKRHGLSIAGGDLVLVDGRWYITSTGLLRIAHRKRCSAIRTAIQKDFSQPTVGRWVFRATVYRYRGTKAFVGYGDADPSNVSPLVRGAEMRVAETRAVNRALRKAYGIGLCSVEELGYLSSRPEPSARAGTLRAHSNGNGSGNAHPRLRDRLCLLIRQHQLDPTLVKRYAAAFSGKQELREASRDLVESFISHLADWASRDRAGLVCKLNSYAQAEEVRP